VSTARADGNLPQSFISRGIGMEAPSSVLRMGSRRDDNTQPTLVVVGAQQG
jgi:hypothetical protein